ncbi:MAG TPA: ATP-binding cassette domain-containing protein [Pirellulaceae bacterium]|nr:ATP-binding cassette domain-containing protein [Pirellulaceae bacterium]
MLVSLNNLSFSYQKENVLNNLSFDVEKGSVLAIVGSSGSGKSTILRLIAGLLDKRMSGTVRIADLNPEQYRKQGKLALMFQQPNLFPNLTVKENISLPLEIIRKENEELTNGLIKAVGLEKYQNSLPNKLSGGMATRVALARAFITKPELLLLDEPFTALDVAWKDALYSELKKLKAAAGTTVILVTHDIEEAISLADKIICLGIDGRVIKEFNNDKTLGLQFKIKQLIVKDHKLRNDYEKDSCIYSN